MAKYLIEVPHEPNKASCDRAILIFTTSGSHFLANADWGCGDGEHKAWMIVESENKEQARSIVPPSLRPQAKVVALEQFRLQDVERMSGYHPPKETA